LLEVTHGWDEGTEPECTEALKAKSDTKKEGIVPRKSRARASEELPTNWESLRIDKICAASGT